MKKLNISQIDTIFTNGSYPIEFLLYFKYKLKTKKIRSALKKLSSAFWPLFGEYDAGYIHFEKYAEQEFFHEEVINEEFDSEMSNESIYEKYCRINPLLMKKLFFLKVIQYKNGTVLIPKFYHLAGDGYSYFYFLSALAAMSRDSYVPFKKSLIRRLYKPHHQRTVLKKFQLENIELKPVPHEEKLTMAIEAIQKQAIKKIIKNIASELDHSVSTNDVLSAMIIKKSVQIQKDYFGDEFQLTIPIDVRRNIKEYGPRFFGNGIMLHVVEFKTKDIKKSSVPELAIEIRKSMPNVTGESYINFLTHIEKLIAEQKIDKLKPYNPKQGCLITNLSRLPVNKLNFGAGNPEFIFPLTIEKNSAAILSDKQKLILRLVN